MYAIDYLKSVRDREAAPTTRVETITPETAMRILEESSSFVNRKVKRTHVAALAEAMRSGHWKNVGDPIRIDSDGRVIDGQHRLLALVEANSTLEFVVIRGLPTESAHYIDIGIPRSGSDMIAMGGATNAFTTVAALNWLYRYRNGTLNVGGRGRLPRYATAAYHAEHPEIDRWVTASQPVRRVYGRTGLVAGAMYHFASIDPVTAEQFHDLLNTGLGMESDHPVYQLREKLIANPKMGEYEASVLFVKAWNMMRSGRRVERLFWAKAKGEEIQEAL